MKNNKIIKAIIILLIIILIIIFVAIYFLNRNKNDSKLETNKSLVNNKTSNNAIVNEITSNDNINNSKETNENGKDKYDLSSLEEGGKDIVENYETVENVKNGTYFYTVQNCLTSYLDNLDSINEQDDEEDEKDEKEEIKDEILNQLDKDYIKKENISKSNIEKIASSTENLKFIAVTKMLQYLVKDNNVRRYVAHTLFTDEKNDIKYLNYIIYFDYVNRTYAIEPTIDTIKDINELNLNREINAIDSNENNKVKYDIINTKELLVNYTKTFRDMCMYASSIAYEYLDEEYRESNFESLADFRKYISDNRANISKMSLESYNFLKSNDNSNSYYCTDSNNNNYIIKENSVMSFSVKLNV